ncbi:MAG: hypothetical protein ACXAD7_00615 [Candidatus Kariarchaeaceae archaeon]|jgi:hypothetical protein
MSSEVKRIYSLANDVMLLGSLGEVVTIQIDLIGVERVADALRSAFSDSEKDGLYIDGMILQRILETQVLDYQAIFDKIIEITGDYESIDSITALVRIMYGDESIEVTVQLTGDRHAPQLMQVTDQSIYFNLINLIQTRWAMASRFASS